MSVDRLYEFLGERPQTFHYFPDEKEMRKVPKQWIASVAFSILGLEFSDWVKDAIDARNEKLKV